MNRKATTARRGMFAVAAAAVAAACAFGAAPASAATVPSAPAVAASSVSSVWSTASGAVQQQLRHGDIGSYVLFVNESKDMLFVKKPGRSAELLMPRESTAISGCSWTSDVDDARADLADGTGASMPLYANNPIFGDAYVQIDGFKWHGDGTDTIHGHTFEVDKQGEIDRPDEQKDKYWVVKYLGSR